MDNNKREVPQITFGASPFLEYGFYSEIENFAVTLIKPSCLPG